MAAGKKEPEEKNTNTPGIERSLREDVEDQLARSPKHSPDLAGQTPEQLIHELQVHQIELETQAEELRRVHLELTEARDKYLDLYEFAPVGYLTLTYDALISEVNLSGATLLGTDRNKLKRARFRKFIAPQDLEAWDRYFKIVLNQNDQQTCTLTLKRDDGVTCPARLESVRLTGMNTITTTVRVAISDISDIRLAEEALASANKKLNLLSSVTRHDINNQLMSANGFLELLHRKVTDPTLEDYFTRIIKANSRISAIIQFSREYEQIGIKAPVWLDTRTLVDTAAKQAPLGKVIVKNDLPERAEMFVDPLIEKMFYNLIDNAVRHGGKIRTIRFSVEESGDDHLIVCEDDGDGIVAVEKEKIFERGFGKNTGLGLALSREILDITGITIKETGEPGKGARFEMMVPKGAWRMNRVVGV